MRKEQIGISYNIELITTDKWTGEVKDRSYIHNAIVDNGLERIAKLLNGVSSVPFTKIGIGTDSTAVTTSDIELGVEVTKAVATATYEADYGAKWSYKFTFGSGESYTITEVGVFDASDVMLNRSLDAGKSVDADTDLTVNITVTVGRA